MARYGEVEVRYACKVLEFGLCVYRDDGFSMVGSLSLLCTASSRGPTCSHRRSFPISIWFPRLYELNIRYRKWVLIHTWVSMVQDILNDSGSIHRRIARNSLPSFLIQVWQDGLQPLRRSQNQLSSISLLIAPSSPPSKGLQCPTGQSKLMGTGISEQFAIAVHYFKVPDTVSSQ